MRHSNYRVIRRSRLRWTPEGRDYVDTYSVHEVFLSDGGLPVGYLRAPEAHYVALSLTELREMHNHYAAALGQPVLETSDFIGGSEDEHADHD